MSKTIYYEFNKPENGSSGWGETFNDDLDTIDSSLDSLSDAEAEIEISISAQVDDTIAVSIQVVDKDGDAVSSQYLIDVWLEDGLGGGETASAPDSSSFTTGTLLATITSGKRWLVITNDAGLAVLEIVENEVNSWYCGAEIRGKDYESAVITFTSTYEDFTTYIKVDPGSTLTVAADSINGTWPDPDLRYLYKDKGVNFFGATFLHKIQVTFTTDCTDYSLKGGCWAVSDVIDNIENWGLNNDQVLGIYLFKAGEFLRLENFETGTFDESISLVGLAVTFYLTIERTSETSIECRIYSDLLRTNLLDTVTVVVVSGKRFRYIFPAQFNSDGATGTISVEDLILA